MTADPAPGRRRVLYGRRHGRRLRPGRQAVLAEMLGRIGIALPEDGGRLDPARLFPGLTGPCWLEVGFGGGEHLAAQATAHPDVGFLGAEPFLNGVASLLDRLRAEAIGNVRIHAEDARMLLDALPDAVLGRVFVLFPDPWPKTRHHKRRFVGPGNLDALARVMADGAELRLATDDPGYLAWMLEHVRGHPAFAWTARGPADWRDPPPGWTRTRYEAKALAAGRRGWHLRFRRLPRPAP